MSQISYNNSHLAPYMTAIPGGAALGGGIPPGGMPIGGLKNE